MSQAQRRGCSASMTSQRAPGVRTAATAAVRAPSIGRSSCTTSGGTRTSTLRTSCASSSAATRSTSWSGAWSGISTRISRRESASGSMRSKRSHQEQRCSLSGRTGTRSPTRATAQKRCWSESPRAQRVSSRCAVMMCSSSPPRPGATEAAVRQPRKLPITMALLLFAKRSSRRSKATQCRVLGRKCRCHGSLCRRTRARLQRRAFSCPKVHSLRRRQRSPHAKSVAS